MNKSYKSVWNESTGSWVAVSELATGRSKSKRAKTAISKAILTQIAVGGMGLAGASIAMAGDPVKLGTGATVNVADGVAIGTDAEADADIGANAGKTGGVAIGNQAYAAGSGVSIGQNSSAGSDSMAMGDSASATYGGTAIGQNARSFAAQSVALGQNASASGKGSLALGADTNAQYSNSTAIGQGATTDRAESVSVGSATIKRQITNVAAGTQDTDATNVSQLKALGASFDTSGNVTNTFVSYDTSAKDLLTLKGASGTKITNVANGALTTASKDAVNGSQLFAVAQSAADAVGGSSTVGADGKITKPVYKINSQSYTSLDSALSAAAASGSGGGAGTDPDAVHYDTTGHTSVTLGAAGVPVKVTNVAAGSSSLDAVNMSQLSAVQTTANKAAGTLNYMGFGPTKGLQANATGADSIALGGNSFATVDKALSIGAYANVSGVNSVAIGYGSNANQSNVVSFGTMSSTRRLVNVSDGVDDNDAVNVGQFGDLMKANANVLQSTVLKSTSKGLLGATQQVGGTQLLGGINSLPGDTPPPTPDQLILAGPTDKSFVIQADGRDSIAIGLNTHATGSNSVASGSNVNATADNAVGFGYTIASAGLNSTAVGVNTSAMADNSTALGNRAYVSVDATNGISIGTNAQTLGLNSVAMGLNSVSLSTDSYVIGNRSTAGGAGTIVIGNDIKRSAATNSVILGSGSDSTQSNVVSIGAAGKERKIVNVAQGTATTDAVNFGQLNSAIAAIPAGGTNGVQYDSTAQDKVTLGGTAATKAVTLTNVAAGANANDAVNMGQLTAMGIVVDSTGKAQNSFVAYDNATSKDSITLLGTAGTKITKLTAGTVSAASTDAINGSQLFNTASTTAAAIGGGATVDASGKVTKPSITVDGSTYDNVAAATTAAGAAATAAKLAAGNAVQYDSTSHASVTFGGTGAAVKLTNVAAGANANDAVNMGQLTAMGIVVDSTGKAQNSFVAYDNATSKDTITLKGTAGSTKITKLTAGTVNATSTDAINGSQLFNTASTTAAAIGGGATVDASGKVTKPSITVDGSTYDNVAAATTAAGAAATAAKL
ncbi:ESPR-type extended signal peptide-containing protein, partial [Caballeronia sordidicola]|uniref:ESPR-type extended signal peptide-containing protein n=1 Tax=Caballeronia sordidicola TaxID=196367 RepID=UPI0004D0274D